MSRRISFFLAAPAVATLLLTACGGSGGGSGGVASLNNAAGGGDATTDTTLSPAAQEEALLKWVACMRGEGLDIADPTVDANGNLRLGGGPGGGGPGGGAAPQGDGAAQAAPFDRDAFQAATETCGSPPQGAGGGGFSEVDREALQESSLKLAECMRAEGITDFPDPDFSNVGPGNGPPPDAQNGDTPRGPFGDVDMSDPKVQAAMTTCRAQLATDGVEFPGGGGPGGGRGTAPATSESGS